MDYKEVSNLLGTSVEKKISQRLFLRRCLDNSIFLGRDISLMYPWVNNYSDYLPTVQVILWEDSDAITVNLEDWLCTSNFIVANRFLAEFGTYRLHNNYWYFFPRSGGKLLFSNGMLVNSILLPPSEIEKDILSHDSLQERRIRHYSNSRHGNYIDNMISDGIDRQEEISRVYYEAVNLLLSNEIDEIHHIPGNRFEENIISALQAFHKIDRTSGLFSSTYPAYWRNILRSIIFLGPHRSKHLFAKIKTVRLFGEPF